MIKPNKTDVDRTTIALTNECKYFSVAHQVNQLCVNCLFYHKHRTTVKSHASVINNDTEQNK